MSFCLRLCLGLVMCLNALSASAQEIRIGGGAAPIENIFRRIRVPFEERTGIRLSLRSDGPAKAFSDLSAGKLDVAAAGLSFKDFIDLMKSSGVDVGNVGDYKSKVIGADRIQVLAHKDLAMVKALSKEQLKGIFTGTIGNWKQVGGPDIAIVVVFGTKIPGTNKLWQERILDGAEWAAGRREAGDAAQVQKVVAAVPGAVGIGPQAAEQNQVVHSPQTNEVARPITAVYKGEPSPALQKLFDFIQKEGQQYIAK